MLSVLFCSIAAVEVGYHGTGDRDLSLIQIRSPSYCMSAICPKVKRPLLQSITIPQPPVLSVDCGAFLTTLPFSMGPRRPHVELVLTEEEISFLKPPDLCDCISMVGGGLGSRSGES